MLVPELVLLLWIKTESDEQFCLLPQQLCQFMHPLQKNGREQNKTKHFTGCFSATLPKTFSITREGKGEVKESINKQSSISNPAYVSMTAKISASSLTLCAVLIAALLMHLAVVKGRSCFSGGWEITVEHVEGFQW